MGCQAGSEAPGRPRSSSSLAFPQHQSYPNAGPNWPTGLLSQLPATWVSVDLRGLSCGLVPAGCTVRPCVLLWGIRSAPCVLVCACLRCVLCTWDLGAPVFLFPRLQLQAGRNKREQPQPRTLQKGLLARGTGLSALPDVCAVSLGPPIASWAGSF